MAAVTGGLLLWAVMTSITTVVYFKAWQCSGRELTRAYWQIWDLEGVATGDDGPDTTQGEM